MTPEEYDEQSRAAALMLWEARNLAVALVVASELCDAGDYHPMCFALDQLTDDNTRAVVVALAALVVTFADAAHLSIGEFATQNAAEYGDAP